MSAEVFRKIAEECRAKEDWHGFLDMRRHLDADGGVSALREVPLTISDEEYGRLVRLTWSWGRNLWENREGWRRVFEGTHRGLASFMSEGDKDKLSAMPNPLTIYRGCVDYNQLGYAWTLDKDRAEYYACFTQGHMNSPVRVIASGKVKHEDIVGYISARNEEEIVVLPELVTQVTYEDITHRPIITEAMMKRKNKAPR